MRPFLQNAYKAHNNGQVNELKLRNVINQLAEQFNLTDEVHTETQPGGKQSVLENLLAQLIYETSLALLTLKKRKKEYLLPSQTLPHQPCKQLKT
jgi:restriction system protein